MSGFDHQPVHDLDTLDVAASILAAPAFVKLGLAVRDERLRERSAYELAQLIVHRRMPFLADIDQLTLPM